MHLRIQNQGSLLEGALAGYTIGARKTRQTRTLLEKFWRISLYVTDDAIAKRSVTLSFVK